MCVCVLFHPFSSPVHVDCLCIIAMTSMTRHPHVSEYSESSYSPVSVTQCGKPSTELESLSTAWIMTWLSQEGARRIWTTKRFHWSRAGLDPCLFSFRYVGFACFPLCPWQSKLETENIADFINQFFDMILPLNNPFVYINTNEYPIRKRFLIKFFLFKTRLF